MGNLFDANIVLTFAAENLDEADDLVEELSDTLYEEGYTVQSVSIEESIPLTED